MFRCRKAHRLGVDATAELVDRFGRVPGRHCWCIPELLEPLLAVDRRLAVSTAESLAVVMQAGYPQRRGHRGSGLGLG